MESLELGHGDEDDNGLPATLDIDLLGGAEVEGSQVGLELSDALQVDEGLAHLSLDLGGGDVGGGGGSEDLSGHDVYEDVR